MPTYKQLTQNFNEVEFACRGNNCCGGSVPINKILIKKLQFLRTKYGVSFRVNCGFRCVTHNKTVDGASPNSQHTKGLAADIAWPSGVDRVELYHDLKELFTGVGLYSSFFHVDIRSARYTEWGSQRYLYPRF